MFKRQAIIERGYQGPLWTKQTRKILISSNEIDVRINWNYNKIHRFWVVIKNKLKNNLK